ncbi:hypothetical protein CCP3SC1_40034 [Gammaproteobacteria bacterium]
MSDDTEYGANCNTYQLGREGYISMNLVTDLANVNARNPSPNNSYPTCNSMMVSATPTSILPPTKWRSMG